MSAIVDRLLGLPGCLVLLVAGLMVLAEDALFVGFVLPGGTIALLAGAAARIGHAPLAFLGGWIAFFRAVMPFLAGTSRMHFPKFLRWNALGGIAWGATVVLAGYAAGASYARVEKSFGRGAAVVVLAVVVIAVVVWRVRRRRARLGA